MSSFSNVSSYASGHQDDNEDVRSNETLSSDLEDEDEEETKYFWSCTSSDVNVNESTFECKDERRFNQSSSIAMLEPSCTIDLQDPMRATCSQFSPDGRWIAVGLTSGLIQVRSVLDGSLALMLDTLKGFKKRRWPCTCMCIRPCKPGESSYNVLLTCDLSGRIHYWHMTSGMHLGISEEVGNSIFAVDFHDKGSKYATGGSDFKIRVYDAATRNLLTTLLERNGSSTSAHSNRVFAVKIYPLDDNIVLSGGWDNTVQIWDMRVQKSVRSIWGARICGEALDIDKTGTLILTGSWRNSHQLQEWDFGTGKLMRNIPWSFNSEQPCRVYTVKYGKDFSSRLIFAGGSISNEACVFYKENSQVIASLNKGGNGAIYSMALSRDGKLWSVTSPHSVKIVKVDQINVFESVKVNLTRK